MILSYIITFVLMMIAGHFKGRLDAIADDDDEKMERTIINPLFEDVD